MVEADKTNGGRYSQIRAVILDYGQVLCLRPEPAAICRMAEMFQIEAGQFLERYASSRGPYDQGLVTADDYWRSFARSAGVEIDAADIRQLRHWDTEMWSRINPEMTGWLEMLHRAGLTTALLSNMELDMAIHARKHFPWLDYFDHQMFSCDVGLIKPDPAIFRECVRRVGVRPWEALFVDDRQDNVEAAEATGIMAIRFESVRQLRTELQESGFQILPGTGDPNEGMGHRFDVQLCR
jgi:putative hydrolase of the HAD superfamily